MKLSETWDQELLSHILLVIWIEYRNTEILVASSKKICITCRLFIFSWLIQKIKSKIFSLKNYLFSLHFLFIAITYHISSTLPETPKRTWLPIEKVNTQDGQVNTVINILLRSWKFESGASANNQSRQIIPQWILKTNVNDYLTIRRPSTFSKSRLNSYA